MRADYVRTNLIAMTHLIGMGSALQCALLLFDLLLVERAIQMSLAERDQQRENWLIKVK